MVAYTNWSVGDTIRFCITVKDFCSSSPNFLTLGNFDIQKSGTPLTCDPWTYSCIDNSNRMVRIKSMKTYSPSSNDVRCPNLSGTVYRELGNALSDSNGIAIIEHTVTEQDRTDYLNAISDGNYYDIVFCIDDSSANIQHAKVQYGVTISPSIATHNLDIYVKPHSWYTPGGAASQITSVIADISGAIINGMTEAGLTTWTYLSTDILTEADRVIIRVYLKETALSPLLSTYSTSTSIYPSLLTYPGIRKLVVVGPWTIISIGIAMVIIGIGMIVGYVLYRAAVTLLEEVYTKEEVGQYTNDILSRMVTNCSANFPTDPVGYANCVKSGIQSVTGAAQDFFDDPTIGQSGQTAADNIDKCTQDYNNPSSPKYHDSEALKACVDAQNQGVQDTITNQTKSKGNPFGAILLLGAGLIGMYIITKPAGQAIPVVIKESRKG